MIEQDLELIPIVEMRIVFSEREAYKRTFLFWYRRTIIRDGLRVEARRAYSNEWFVVPFFLETMEGDYV